MKTTDHALHVPFASNDEARLVARVLSDCGYDCALEQGIRLRVTVEGTTEEATHEQPVTSRAVREILLAIARHTEGFEANRRELQAVLDCAEEGIEAVDAKGMVKYANPAFFRVMGLEPHDRIGRNIPCRQACCGAG